MNVKLENAGQGSHNLKKGESKEVFDVERVYL